VTTAKFGECLHCISSVIFTAVSNILQGKAVLLAEYIAAILKLENPGPTYYLVFSFSVYSKIVRRRYVAFSLGVSYGFNVQFRISQFRNVTFT